MGNYKIPAVTAAPSATGPGSMQSHGLNKAEDVLAQRPLMAATARPAVTSARCPGLTGVVIAGPGTTYLEQTKRMTRG